jgi:hypothetical protein
VEKEALGHHARACVCVCVCVCRCRKLLCVCVCRKLSPPPPRESRSLLRHEATPPGNGSCGMLAEGEAPEAEVEAMRAAATLPGVAHCDVFSKVRFESFCIVHSMCVKYVCSTTHLVWYLLLERDLL